MAKPPLTEKLVYLALKDIFRGDGSQPSTIEEIRKTIEKHKDEPKIGALIQSHGVESVCKVAQDLLKYQIFVSMAKAEVRFPEVFEVLPAQAEQATTTGTKVATSSSAAVRSAGTCKSEELLGIGDRIRIRKVKERARSSMLIWRSSNLNDMSKFHQALRINHPDPYHYHSGTSIASSSKFNTLLKRHASPSHRNVWRMFYRRKVGIVQKQWN
jgi:hypothetical protein